MRHTWFRRNRRATYVVSGALLTTLVVTAGSILTYTLITPQIQKGKDRNNLDVVRNVLRNLDSNIRGLLANGPNSSKILRLTIPKGIITTNPRTDVVAYSLQTKVKYDPGSTSTLEVERTDKLLTIRTDLPVDLVTRYSKIMPGQHVVTLTFEKERWFAVSNWTLHRNASFSGTVNSTTGSYYVSVLNESKVAFDMNRDGDRKDYWILYLSDPNEQYVFDTFAIHEPDGTLVQVLEEGDCVRLGDLPLMVYRVRERFVVLRYARIRMDVK